MSATPALSPEAAHVLRAAIHAYWSNEKMCPNDPHVIAAAVARAIVECVYRKYFMGTPYTSTGAIIQVARELEAFER